MFGYFVIYNQNLDAFALNKHFAALSERNYTDSNPLISKDWKKRA